MRGVLASGCGHVPGLLNANDSNHWLARVAGYYHNICPAESARSPGMAPVHRPSRPTSNGTHTAPASCRSVSTPSWRLPGQQASVAREERWGLTASGMKYCAGGTSHAWGRECYWGSSGSVVCAMVGDGLEVPTASRGSCPVTNKEQIASSAVSVSATCRASRREL